jgi:hypothetical protein
VVAGTAQPENATMTWGSIRRFPWLELGLSLFTSVLFIVAGEVVVRNLLLERYGRRIDAQVTEAREVRRGRRSWNSKYVVKYRFRCPGDERWYTHTDLITHGPCHVGLRKPQWKAARGSGHLEVMYVPRFPSINRPVN